MVALTGRMQSMWRDGWSPARGKRHCTTPPAMHSRFWHSTASYCTSFWCRTGETQITMLPGGQPLLHMPLTSSCPLYLPPKCTTCMLSERGGNHWFYVNSNSHKLLCIVPPCYLLASSYTALRPDMRVQAAVHNHDGRAVRLCLLEGRTGQVCTSKLHWKISWEA